LQDCGAINIHAVLGVLAIRKCVVAFCDGWKVEIWLLVAK